MIIKCLLLVTVFCLVKSDDCANSMGGVRDQQFENHVRGIVYKTKRNVEKVINLTFSDLRQETKQAVSELKPVNFDIIAEAFRIQIRDLVAPIAAKVNSIVVNRIQRVRVNCVKPLELVQQPIVMNQLYGNVPFAFRTAIATLTKSINDLISLNTGPNEELAKLTDNLVSEALKSFLNIHERISIAVRRSLSRHLEYTSAKIMTNC